MDTIRVNIAYRPLRICWAIESGDIDTFREVVKTNHALWGGRFNPIVVVEREREARAIVEAFRPDIILSSGNSVRVNEFVSNFPHLKTISVRDGIFGRWGADAYCRVLDINNAILASQNTSEWEYIRRSKPRIYEWDNDDLLSDVFLMQLGAYPNSDLINVDYEELYREAFDAQKINIGSSDPLSVDLLEVPNIAYMSRFQLRSHFSIQPSRGYHGFYVGDASNLDDLVGFWNLCAADLSLLFVDREQSQRYARLIPSWKKHVFAIASGQLSQHSQQYAVWSTERPTNAEDADALRALFGDGPCSTFTLNEHLWTEHNMRAPMMYFKDTTVLGVLIMEGQKPKISFPLSDRPYSSHTWFRSQQVVASISCMGALYGREDFTLDIPYMPELNEFYARSMHHFGQFRVESGRIALIVGATVADSYVYALPTAELFKQVFSLAGFIASVSSGGLIARQLISQLGGLQGGRVFKIPGARRLLKTYGPLASFRKRAALQLIGKRDPENPEGKFEDHANLYLEPREPGTSLKSEDVFSYLVSKRLFRIGSELNCPHCQLKSWFPVDDLRQRVNCQMCGEVFDATVQLVGGEWDYRRSGVLGTERNSQGAIPVVLTLQQLDSNLQQFLVRQSYAVSLDLSPTRGQLKGSCEVDFAWLIPGIYPEKSIIIIGECKDRGQSPVHGGDGGTINANDIRNLRVIADSFPPNRFQVFILLAKLCAFTPNEIELARSLNNDCQPRVIMLTERELEPTYFFERTWNSFDIEDHASTPEALARATIAIFLEPQPLDPNIARRRF